MLIVLLCIGVVSAFPNYHNQPSGYGNNNQDEVQEVAKKSPHNKPVDYTKASDFPGSNVIGNLFNQQNLGQINTQGQQNVQKGGDQTNVGVNQNEVNVGQTNNQNVGGPTNVIGNKFDLQTLEQVNTQGQASVQQGGDQTNVGSNANAVNVGQVNNQGGAGINGGYKPSYDASSYGADNKFDIQNLGQVSNQGQSNTQQGGAQTNVGSNANTVNVGQQNNQGGAGAGYKPSYDAPSYGGSGHAGGPIYITDFNNFIKNNVNSQNLGQANTQGQQNVQKGGDQTNVGVNQVNVGQENNQGSGKPSYDAPRYGGNNGQYNPFNFIDNKVFQQNLGQVNTQGQSNAQIGGAQTNVGVNTNAVNVGQTNNQDTGSGNKAYDKPYKPAPPSYKPAPPAYKPAPKPAPPAYKPEPENTGYRH
ncbi:hypothetical protein Aduo_010694 [Ancylostoma duodenale]